MAIKHTYEYVKDYIEKEGYKLISTEYINNLQKLKIICPEGHECELSFGKFVNGRRCKHCSKIEKKKKLSLNINLVKEGFYKEGYELLEKEYISAITPMKYKCPNGHIHEMCWNSFQQGHRCPECKGTLKYTYEEVKSFFEKYGFILLTKQYERARQQLEYICPQGHKHYTTWTWFKKNHYCTICENKMKNIEIVKELMEQEDYKVLSNIYKNNRTKLEVKCPKGHIYKTTWHDFSGGCRCPICGNNYKGEIKIKEVLEDKNIDFIPQYRFNDCRDIQPLPFDFYIPSLNICVEYDGEGHYEPIDFKGNGKAQEEFEIRVKHDQIKDKYCLDNNIKLIRVPYWEFDNIENILKQELNLE